MQSSRKRTLVERSLLTALVVGLIVAAGVVVLANQTKTGTAYFTTVKSIYPDDRLRIAGVDVGKIDAITPEDGRVKVDFSYDSKYDVPADAKAAIVSPTLVSTRFIQLAPAYAGGPTLPEGGVIPQERTASPLEFDELKRELSRLANGLGPGGVDQEGALSRFLDVSARNGAGGNGKRFNQLVREAAGAAEALQKGGPDLFGTVSNLQVFANALGQLDGQIVEFNNRLGDVSGVLDENSEALDAALKGVERAAGDIDAFIASNGKDITGAVDDLGQFTRTLSSQRENLANILHVAPNTLMNFRNMFQPRTQALVGELNIDNTNTPADLVCTAYGQATSSKPVDSVRWCTSHLGPILNVLRMYQPPAGVAPLDIPKGGRPTEVPGPGPESGGLPPREPELPPQQDLPGLGGLSMPSGGN